jgi:neutral ceramidase
MPMLAAENGRQRTRLFHFLFLTVCLWMPPSQLDAAEKGFRAGLASRVITPERPMWMAGYANRDRPAEGKLHDLYVKALALEDASGQMLVLVTTDLLGMPRELSEVVANEVKQRTGLARERLMLTSSHTHCGPVLRSSLSDMYPLSPEQQTLVDAYTERLRGWMVETIVQAIHDLKPAQLAIGKGTASFALNRRQPLSSGIKLGENPRGPVDHDVPVLRVVGPDQKLRALVFGYACHNTTLSFYQWCGDYAGFAQVNLEAKHPGATAFFWMGCGADANPAPRGSTAFCEQHGRELAEAVDKVLAGEMTPVTGRVAAAYTLIELPFDTLPTQEKLTADLANKTFAVRHRAARLLSVLNKGGQIDDRYRYYPIQAWRLGDQLLWLGLGGEVVVDYSLRFKSELGRKRPLWITGYANDVMAYIPSLRVLREGGYEGDTSMVYYGMPTKWASSIEESIVTKVHELAQRVDNEK